MAGNENSGNPNAGKTNGFGTERGADPATAGRIGGRRGSPALAASIRGSKRDMANRKIILKEGEKFTDLTEQELAERVLPTREPTLAQINAARLLAKGAVGDARAAEQNADDIDGKLLQPNMNLDVEAIKGQPDADLWAIINEAADAAREFDAHRAGGAGGTGPETPGGSAGAGAEPAGGAADTGSAGEVPLPIPGTTV